MQTMTTWEIKFSDNSPIYAQIVDKFYKLLIQKELELGERIPSIRDMSALLRVNTNTVQRAYQELERKNLIYSQRGMGYFVKEDQTIIDTIKQDLLEKSVSQFLSEMRALGLQNEEILEMLRLEIKKEVTVNVTNS